uniref:leucine-rich repeat protein n=1 Tax=Alistipes sp. TaxID=1872444 RepID=UPI004057A623
MKRRLTYFLGLSLLLMGGCASDPDELVTPNLPEAELLPIKLHSEIEQVATTRVNDSGFCDGDKVGIYVVNWADGAAGELLNRGNQVDNVRYTYEEATNYWRPAYEVYYYDRTTPVDVIGYYPYGSPDEVDAMHFEVAQDQSTEAIEGQLGGYEASDFLWAKTEGYLPSESAVALKFTHRMAGVQVTMLEGNGFEEGEFDRLDKAVLMQNLTRTAKINLQTGEVSPVGEAATTGTVMVSVGDAEFRAVAVPQVVEAGNPLFRLTLGGTPYNFSYKVNGNATDMEYHAGKLTKFTIRLSKKALGGFELELVGIGITAWESDNVTHDATTREYIVIEVPAAAGDGSSALKEAIIASGHDYTKLKNLKITGEVDAYDFFFMRDEMTRLQSVNMKEATIAAVQSYAANEIPVSAFRDKKSLVRFVFPEGITKIGINAFDGSNLSGSLQLPNSVVEIGSYAFGSCPFSGRLILSKNLEIIEGNAFYGCSGFIGSLELPAKLRVIGGHAFGNCSGFTGSLQLPESLEELGASSFSECSSLTGSLTIPPRITTIPAGCFNWCGFDGILTLPKNLTTIEELAFFCCRFSGNLELPEGLLSIGQAAFYDGDFSGELKLPSSLAVIESQAFYGNNRLTGMVEIPKDIQSIPRGLFSECNDLQGVILPRGIEAIQDDAFKNCYQLNSIVCKAQTPPMIVGGPFDGVAKDNFTVEVPEASVAEYSTAPGWNEFKRIAAHHDFSISRRLFRTLNASLSKELVLRAPAGESWSVEAKPDWVTVTPSSGVGKTEVTITVDEQAQGAGNRTGEVVFLLNGKDYRSTTLVEQYDYTYGDGDVMTVQQATKGNGVNLLFMGDCFDAKDIAEGLYLSGIEEAVEHFFAVEPYRSYRDHFNVYILFGLSPDSGVGTVNTIREGCFGSQYGLQAAGSVGLDEAKAFAYALKAPTVNEENLSESPIVMVENTFEYDGITYLWGDGSAIALCPMSQDDYPYDYRGIVQHEAGGHAFAKLADEYIYHNAFIQTCTCNCCSHVDELSNGHSRGWYQNISLTGNMHEVAWSHLIFDEKYQNVVDIYEGGYFHARGVFRSESNSCMNNNVPYFSAISREEIVKRIMAYGGLEYSFEAFKEKDVMDATVSAIPVVRDVRSMVVTPSHQHAPVYKGEKPQIRR